MIKFGTDGWRAVIAEEFNFDNAKAVFQAIADYISGIQVKKAEVAVGYDTRFLSRRYGELAASVLAGNGIKVQLSDNYLSTPNLSYQIFEEKLAGGIMISASHNPPVYNGVKFKAEYAGSASPEITSRLEAKLNKNLPKIIDFQQAVNDREIVIKDFRPAYLTCLKTKVDFDRIAASGLKVVFDSQGGAGQGYLEEIFKNTSLELIPLRSHPDPLFYGVYPEPIPENLGELATKVTDIGADLGIAFDGDADRIGGMDETGAYLSSHQIFSLLLMHLHENRGAEGRVIKTVSVSAMVEKLALAYGLEVVETPVGFKYISSEMLKEDVLIGGEESGGIGVINYIPERDGLLNALLLLELMIYSGKKPGVMWRELEEKFGPHHYKRVDKTFNPEEFKKIKRQLYAFSESDEIEIAGYEVKRINRRDGYKFIFNDDSDWVMVRLSGTEPVLRLYCEAASKKEVDRILSCCLKRFEA